MAMVVTNDPLALTRLLQQGEVLEVRVEGMNPPLYVRSEDISCLNQILDSNVQAPRAVILAPLDNLLWDRRFVEELFDFHYHWEVYKPVAERQYGYYVPPILYGDRFVARFEPGRDKKSGALIIKNWWWESGVNPSKRMQSDLTNCFKRFLRYLGTDDLRIDSEIVKQARLDWLTSISS